MKKIFSAVVVLIATIASTVFVSCGSNNDDDKVNTQTVSIMLEPNDDVLTLFDISVVYTDGNGTTQTEAVTGKFTKSFTVSKFPSTGTVSLKATPKSTITEGKYYPTINCTYQAGSLNRISKLGGLAVDVSSKEDAQTYADKKINSYKWTWNFLADGSVEKSTI